MPGSTDRLEGQLVLNTWQEAHKTFTRIIQQHQQMEAALKFYAEQTHYDGDCDDLMADRGARARQALKMEAS